MIAGLYVCHGGIEFLYGLPSQHGVGGSDNLAGFQEQREASLDGGNDDGLGFGKCISANGEEAGNCPGGGNSLLESNPL